MSGGFFRGTSADQDTRFSNKQAKLLKTQKFALELEHLVDMTKVKMDVMKPWIANRVTELLGFEDEVLINFIYGLLDGKEVNGKEVQISLTGFMEKNTGKFMKELWTLLLSAQQNASGVPQQFLDAKEEETRKKKAESDRIADEIRIKREKENKEWEQEKLKKMDGGVEARNAIADLELGSDRLAAKASNARTHDREDMGRRNGMRGRGRVSRSPRHTDQSPSSLRSISKSFSNSGSHSGERRHRSRSVSKSPRKRGRSVSSEHVRRFPRRRSLTPRRRYSPIESRSPPRRRSSYYRRRSRSRLHRSSVSPMRRRLRSPVRRLSRSPVRRRSVTPVRRRRSPSPVRRRSPSPQRRRSPSPMRRRSPQRHMSPSPVERQSPSPVGRRSSSPAGRKSTSPMRRRSPVAVRRRSPSPVRRRLRSPVRRRSPSPLHGRSISPLQRRSPSPMSRRQRRSRSAPRQRSPPQARGRSPIIGRRRSVTPSRRSSNELSSSSPICRRSLSPSRRSLVIRRSPDQSSKGRRRLHGSPARRPTNHRETKRSSSPGESPAKAVRNQAMHGSRLDSPRGLGKHRQYSDSSDTSEQQKEKHIARESWNHNNSNLEEKRSVNLSFASKHDDPNRKQHKKDLAHSEKATNDRTSGSQGCTDASESRKKGQGRLRERSGKSVYLEGPDTMPLPLDKASLPGDKEKFLSSDGKKSENKKHAVSDNVKDKPENVSKPLEKGDDQRGGASDTASEESEKWTYKSKEKKRHRKSKRHGVNSDSDSYDSEAEERKEAKRRRKEEKKLRKEEKRRYREERRRRKEERRAERLKAKRRGASSSPSDSVKHPSDVDSSDGEPVARKYSRARGEEPEKEQKKLEIELRMKALESFKAKKGAHH